MNIISKLSTVGVSLMSVILPLVLFAAASVSVPGVVMAQSQSLLSQNSADVAKSALGDSTITPNIFTNLLGFVIKVGFGAAIAYTIYKAFEEVGHKKEGWTYTLARVMVLVFAAAMLFGGAGMGLIQGGQSFGTAISH